MKLEAISELEVSLENMEHNTDEAGHIAGGWQGEARHMGVGGIQASNG